jgi:hypothetical protein
MPLLCTRCGTPNHGNKSGSPCSFCGETIYGNPRIPRKPTKEKPVYFPDLNGMVAFSGYISGNEQLVLFNEPAPEGFTLLCTFMAPDKDTARKVMSAYIAKIRKLPLLPMPKNPNRFYDRTKVRPLRRTESLADADPSCLHEIIYSFGYGECIKCDGHFCNIRY